MNKFNTSLVAAAMGLVSVLSLATESGKPAEIVEKRNYVQLERGYPAYPGDAAKSGTEGHVVVEYDITAAGTVENIRVLESRPAEVFDQAALEAVGKWTYLPPYKDGRAQDVRGVQTRLTFVLGDSPEVFLGEETLANLEQLGPADVEDVKQMALHYRTADQHNKAAQVVADYVHAQDDIRLAALEPLLQAVAWHHVEPGSVQPILQRLQKKAYASTTGNRYVVLAALHEQQKNWPASQLALAKAFEKGRLNEPSVARFMLARVLYHANHLNEAATVLRSLTASDADDQMIEAWLQRVEKKARERQYVAQHLLESALR